MFKKATLFLLILWIVNLAFTEEQDAILLEFNEQDQEEYYQNTTSNQDIYLNNKKYISVKQQFKAHFKVAKIDQNQLITHAVYSIYRYNSKKNRFQLKNSIKTKFERRKNGELIIDNRYSYPALRNIPRFPAYKVKINDTWTGQSFISQDLTNLGVKKGSLFQVNSRYRYLRNEDYKGQKCAVISCFFVVNVNFNKQIGKKIGQINPSPNGNHLSRWMGIYEAEYYYSINEKMIRHFKANFDYLFFLVNGQMHEFKGKDIGDISKK